MVEGCGRFKSRRKLWENFRALVVTLSLASESITTCTLPRGSCRLRATLTPTPSLSGTFLQTPQELVTPLKWHSLSPPICLPGDAVNATLEEGCRKAGLGLSLVPMLIHNRSCTDDAQFTGYLSFPSILSSVFLWTVATAFFLFMLLYVLRSHAAY